MTYKYYKENFEKLTKVERNSNKEYRTRYYTEKDEDEIAALKSRMNERLKNFLKENRDLNLV